MSQKKDTDFVPYKFKSLKVYSSTEWLAGGEKKYQRVFEREEVTYLYAEFSFFNKLFDEEDWTVKVKLLCYALSATAEKERQMCEINVDREVKSEENIVYIREGWGNPTSGAFWQEGGYMWEAYLDDKLVATNYFYVTAEGRVTKDENPYFDLQSIRLFEDKRVPARQGPRTFYTKFHGKKTRYVWAELRLQNKAQSRDWPCEVFMKFYNDARQLKGKTSELVKVKKGQSEITIYSGWGSENPGSWFEDNYTLEVAFMDQLIAIVPYEVGSEFTEGETIPLLPGTAEPIAIKPVQPEQSLDELLAELNQLTGLMQVKQKVQEYIQYLQFLQLRKEKGFEEGGRINLHAVFTGNPGTGKTTVALRLGKIYKQMGLLSKGHVHEVDRSDLVGEYIGQTAPKVKEAIKKARGGILFIDEAYALARSGDDSKDFGKEVIEILLKELSDGKGDLAVLVAGYPEEMRVFLDSNPGLKSRFNLYFEFSDYLPDELMEIAAYACQKRDVSLAAEAKAYLYEKLVEAYRNRDKSFGNARYVNSLIDEGKMNMGLRVMREIAPDKITHEQLSTIELQDLRLIFGEKEIRKAHIPIDEGLLQEALQELNELIGLHKVKHEIHELIKLVRFYREIGKDVTHTFSLHTVFTGNPGTGKTTVARILSKIYKALGVLERGHLVECDRQMLVGAYQGQTAIKTAAQVEAAMGGVLFIDEAYSLTDRGGGYGREAVETLLKRMEDQRGEFVVIAAGYPDNMNYFLESNPGLKSRFDKTFVFEDYTAEELYEIASLLLSKEGLRPSKKAETHLKAYFNFLHAYKDKFFGNARAIRKVIEEAVKNQHLRLAGLPAEKRNVQTLGTLTFDDVVEFELNKDTLSKQSKIGFGVQGAGGTSS